MVHFQSPFVRLLLVTLLLATTTIAVNANNSIVTEPRTSIGFDEKFQRNTLQTLGVRTKGPIKVYAVGQYGKQLFLLKMNFSVNAEKMANALVDALKPRCEKLKCDSGQVEEFKQYVVGALPDGAKSGTKLLFNTGGNKVTLAVNGKAAAGKMSGKAISQAFAGIYTDSSAVCRMNPIELTSSKKVTQDKSSSSSDKEARDAEFNATLGIVAATTLAFILWITKPDATTRVSQLNLYPIKSCAEQSVEQATVTPKGFSGDRIAMVVDKEGKCCTSRDKDKAKLFFMQPTVELNGSNDAESIRVTAGAAYYPLDVDLTKSAPTKSISHNEAPGTLQLQDYGNVAAAWFETATGIPGARLTGIGSDYKRNVMVNPGQGDAVPLDNAPVSLADEAPFLLTNEASLEDLNQRLEAQGKLPVDMRRFRPNIVLLRHSDAKAWEEDTWLKIRIGDHVEFFVWQPCGRCTMTTIDRDSLARTGEPLATLNTFRENKHGQRNFGMHLVPDPATLRSDSVIRVGDTMEVLEYHQERLSDWKEKFDGQ